MVAEKLKAFMVENGFQIQEFDIPGLTDFCNTFHSCVIDRSGNPVSGGFGADKLMARKIALAEFIERLEVGKIRSENASVRKLWGLDLISTACGFAAGFNLQNTVYRSLGEGIERWVMSQWIDNGLYIEELDFYSVEKSLDTSSKFIISQFENVRFFKKNILLAVNEKIYEFDVVSTMAYLGNGIFPGSAIRKVNGSIWQHSLIESFRHLLAFNNNPGVRDKFPANKVNFFANNRDVADRQIAKANIIEWPLPVLGLHYAEPRFNGEAFIARTIIKGWDSWDRGPIERFLY